MKALPQAHVMCVRRLAWTDFNARPRLQRTPRDFFASYELRLPADRKERSAIYIAYKAAYSNLEREYAPRRKEDFLKTVPAAILAQARDDAFSGRRVLWAKVRQRLGSDPATKSAYFRVVAHFRALKHRDVVIVPRGTIAAARERNVTFAASSPAISTTDGRHLRAANPRQWKRGDLTLEAREALRRATDARED